MPRPLVAAALLVGGAAVGLGSVAVHGYWWGLVLAVAAPVAATVTLPAGWWSRLPFAAGWVLVVALLTLPRSEGDYLVAADVPGYTLLVTALVLIVAAVVSLVSSRPSDSRSDSGSGGTPS